MGRGCKPSPRTTPSGRPGTQPDSFLTACYTADLIPQAALDKHEADGTTDSKEYHDAVDVFYARHVCRLDPMPTDVVEAFGSIEKDPTVYLTM